MTPREMRGPSPEYADLAEKRVAFLDAWGAWVAATNPPVQSVVDEQVSLSQTMAVVYQLMNWSSEDVQ